MSKIFAAMLVVVFALLLATGNPEPRGVRAASASLDVQVACLDPATSAVSVSAVADYNPGIRSITFLLFRGSGGSPADSEVTFNIGRGQLPKSYSGTVLLQDADFDWGDYQVQVWLKGRRDTVATFASGPLAC